MNLLCLLADTKLSLLFLALAFLAVLGCSDSLPLGQVEGEVTVDGKPLDSGTIRFADPAGKLPSVGGVIKEGKFAVSVPVAKQRVEIIATRLPPGAKLDRHSQAEFTVIQLVPEQYNTKSKLTLDVREGLNEPHFDLTAKH